MKKLCSSSIGGLWSDVRYGARLLRRSPAFALVAISALSIGVAANVTIFSFVNAWLRPMDAAEPHRLLRITGPGGDRFSAAASDDAAHISPRDYAQYRNRNQSFSDIAASHPGGPTRVRITGPAQMIPVTPVTGNYFDVLGVKAAFGRTLTLDDARTGAKAVIVLSDAGWRRFFAADPHVIGTTPFLNGVPHTVVGVMPAWFTGTTAPTVPQIYRTFDEGPDGVRFPWGLHLLGRLRPGVSQSQAHADLTRIASQLTSEDRQRRSIELYPARNVFPFMLRAIAVLASVFVLIVGSVLLIACENVAILSTIRSASRSREIAVRLALGASRPRLLMQLLTESALLCTIAGVAGMMIAYQIAQYATRFYAPVPMSIALTFKLDWRVIAFAVAASTAALMLCGLMPALKAMKTDLVSSLRGTVLASGVRSSLIVTQMMLTTALLITAVVLVHSLSSSIGADQGFVSRNVVMTTTLIDGDVYRPERRLQLVETLLERIEQAPGVAAAAMIENVPLANNAPIRPVRLRSGERNALVYQNRASRGLFNTLGITLLAGRDFAVSDNTAPASVGIVNETLARTLWPGESALGKYLLGDEGTLIEVIGLVRDSKYDSIDESAKPFLYRPAALAVSTTPTFLLKPAGDPGSIVTLVRDRLTALDPDLVAYNVMTLDDRLTLGLMVNRAAAAASGGLGLLALALGAIGIYGTMSFLVQQRRREIGIRLALGATRASVMRLVTRQGLIWSLAGMAAGIGLGGVAAFGLSRVVRGVQVFDAPAFLMITVALTATVYLACYAPARRASRVDPIATLRDE